MRQSEGRGSGEGEEGRVIRREVGQGWRVKLERKVERFKSMEFIIHLNEYHHFFYWII